MTTFITFIHILICFFIIGVVLLQSGKGAEMGASFGSGGGSQSVFGAGGGSNFMTKLTTAAAIIFMLTSLTLAYFSGHLPSASIMSGKQAPKAATTPAQPQPASPAPAQTAPTQPAPVK